jgi:hypothetical protein
MNFEFLAYGDRSGQKAVDVGPRSLSKDTEPDATFPSHIFSLISAWRCRWILFRIAYQKGVAGGVPPTMAKPCFKASPWKGTTCRTVPDQGSAMIDSVASDLQIEFLRFHLPTGKQMIGEPGAETTRRPAACNLAVTYFALFLTRRILSCTKRGLLEMLKNRRSRIVGKDSVPRAAHALSCKRSSLANGPFAPSEPAITAHAFGKTSHQDVDLTQRIVLTQILPVVK